MPAKFRHGMGGSARHRSQFQRHRLCDKSLGFGASVHITHS